MSGRRELVSSLRRGSRVRRDLILSTLNPATAGSPQVGTPDPVLEAIWEAAEHRPSRPDDGGLRDGLVAPADRDQAPRAAPDRQVLLAPNSVVRGPMARVSWIDSLATSTFHPVLSVRFLMTIRCPRTWAAPPILARRDQVGRDPGKTILGLMTNGQAAIVRELYPLLGAIHDRLADDPDGRRVIGAPLASVREQLDGRQSRLGREGRPLPPELAQDAGRPIR